tara:strand:+ start:542 stop:733 length:192 start_codon:yes stop_codon:yes gene_type:complete
MKLKSRMADMWMSDKSLVKFYQKLIDDGKVSDSGSTHQRMKVIEQRIKAKARQYKYEPKKRIA